MNMANIPFGTTDWETVDRTEHAGITGTAYWRTRDFAGIRVRMVEYTAGYLSDHWCSKGHILLCLSGELETSLEDGRVFILKPGMSYQVADNCEAHRSRTRTGATLFIVD
jgi:quercetin dioxygenase-like cupin family protein